MEAKQIELILTEAKQAARKAASEYFERVLGGVDQFSCGFAWVEIYEYKGERIKGNTKIGKAMKSAGIKQDFTRTYRIWNPAEFGCQNIDTLECGAQAAAEVFNKYGFTAYMGSRLD